MLLPALLLLALLLRSYRVTASQILLTLASQRPHSYHVGNPLPRGYLLDGVGVVCQVPNQPGCGTVCLPLILAQFPFLPSLHGYHLLLLFFPRLLRLLPYRLLLPFLLPLLFLCFRCLQSLQDRSDGRHWLLLLPSLCLIDCCLPLPLVCCATHGRRCCDLHCLALSLLFPFLLLLLCQWTWMHRGHWLSRRRCML